MSEQKTHWEGKQWKVTDEGMEAFPVSYHIAAERLGEINSIGDEDMADWLFHLPEKEWLDYPDFVQAFFIALDVHEGKYKPLSNKAIGEGLAKGIKRQNEILLNEKRNVA